jgi:molybdenum cofactor cytidylyltransferase
MAHARTFRAFAVVPAAGRSQRMGRPKLLLPWRNATVIEHVLAAWLASDVERVVVVVHPDDASLAEICRRAGAEVVIPPAAPPEMKDSVLHALDFLRVAAAPSASDVWLLAPADMPTLPTAAIDLVIAAHDPDDARILVPRHAGRRGHPVLFPWPLCDEVARLGPSEGLNQLRRRFPVRELDFIEPAVLADLDTPDDYRRLRESHGPASPDGKGA